MHDLGEYTKNERRLIHRGIDDHFGKLLMSKTLPEQNVIEVRKKPKKRHFQDNECCCSEFIM